MAASSAPTMIGGFLRAVTILFVPLSCVPMSSTEWGNKLFLNKVSECNESLLQHSCNGFGVNYIGVRSI